jgi:hypothetical protein
VVSTVAWVEAVSWACGWSAAPVVSDGLALLAGGTRWADGTGDEVPVMQAVDEAGERFRLTWPDSGRDIEPGAVTVAPGGDLVFPVYEHDTSLQVLRVSRDGAVVARDELPDDPYDVVAFDVASKLRVAVTPVNGQDYLCSWLYRQGRTQGTTYRSWGEPDYRWYGEEWPLSVSDDQVVGVNGGRWVSRDPATGAVRWLADLAGYRPAGSGPGSLHAVRAGPDAEPKPGEWSTMLALDPGTGRPRWETQVDGTVRSATSGPGTVCVAAELPDGGRSRWTRRTWATPPGSPTASPSSPRRRRVAAPTGAVRPACRSSNG